MRGRWSGGNIGPGARGGGRGGEGVVHAKRTGGRDGRGDRVQMLQWERTESI